MGSDWNSFYYCRSWDDNRYASFTSLLRIVSRSGISTVADGRFTSKDGLHSLIEDAFACRSSMVEMNFLYLLVNTCLVDAGRMEGNSLCVRGRSEVPSMDASKDVRFSALSKPRRQEGGALGEEDLLFEKFRLSLVRLGEDGSKMTEDLESHIIKLSEAVVSYSTSSYKDALISVFLDCACYCPFKINMIGSLISVVHRREPAFVDVFLTEAAERISSLLAASQWMEAKNILRCIAEMVSDEACSCDSFLTWLTLLLNVTEEQFIPQDRSDTFVYLVLSVLPWCNAYIQRTKGDSTQYDDMLRRIGLYMDARPVQTQTGTWFAPNLVSPSDRLHLLWDAVLQNTSVLLKPWETLVKFLQPQPPAILQSPITIPPHDDAAMKYLERYHPLQLKSMRIPEDFLSELDRLLLEDFVWDILKFFGENPTEGAVQLLLMHTSANFPIIVMEVILAALLNLPKSSFPLVFLSAVLLELCRLEGGGYAVVLSATVSMLLSDMENNWDVEAIFRLASWFAYHLSNVGFVWDWPVDQSMFLGRKSLFLQACISGCLRLSFEERLKAVIPVELHTFIPRDRELDTNLSESMSSAEREVARNLVSRVLDKISVSELEHYISQSFGMTRVERRLDILMDVLLLLGSETLSHQMVLWERYGSLIKSFVERDAGNVDSERLRILNIVGDFWKNSEQHLSVLPEQLCLYGIVDDISYARWLFSEPRMTACTQSWIWEVSLRLLDRLTARNVVDPSDENVKDVLALMTSTMSAYFISTEYRENSSSLPAICALELLKAIGRRYAQWLNVLEEHMSWEEMPKAVHDVLDSIR